MKYFTVARSEEIVSPMAHKLGDLTVGHCSVKVRLHTPFSSRERVPEDSVPTMGLTTNLVEVIKLGCRRGVDSEAIVRELEGTAEERESAEESGLSRGSS